MTVDSALLADVLRFERSAVREWHNDRREPTPGEQGPPETWWEFCKRTGRTVVHPW